IIDASHRWSRWAAPKGADGKIDHNRALTGPDLIDYVNRELFPYLHGFKGRATSPATIEYKIGEIFGEIRNKFTSGYSLRDALDIVHTNTLSEPVLDIQEKDRFDVILANPPFGGKERPEIQQNFPIKTGETAYLFLQHFIKSLRAGGSAAVVIKNTFLSNTDNASVALRKELLESCNLRTVLDMPGGTFQGAGVKTVVLFFEQGERTRSIWYYRLE